MHRRGGPLKRWFFDRCVSSPSFPFTDWETDRSKCAYNTRITGDLLPSDTKQRRDFATWTVCCFIRQQSSRFSSAEKCVYQSITGRLTPLWLCTCSFCCVSNFEKECAFLSLVSFDALIHPQSKTDWSGLNSGQVFLSTIFAGVAIKNISGDISLMHISTGD